MRLLLHCTYHDCALRPEMDYDVIPVLTREDDGTYSFVMMYMECPGFWMSNDEGIFSPERFNAEFTRCADSWTVSVAGVIRSAHDD